MPEEFDVNGTTVAGDVALPQKGHGPGGLVLHAWGGLTPFFEDVCERLATEGFVAFAPDRYGGPTAATIEEAESLQLQREDWVSTEAAALRGRSITQGRGRLVWGTTTPRSTSGGRRIKCEGRGRHCVPPGARRGSTPTLAWGTGSSRRTVVATTKLRQPAWPGSELWTSCEHTLVRTSTR